MKLTFPISLLARNLSWIFHLLFLLFFVSDQASGQCFQNGTVRPSYCNIVVTMDQSWVDKYGGDVVMARMVANQSADDAITALNDSRFKLDYDITFSRIFTPPALAPSKGQNDRTEWCIDVNQFFSSEYPCISAKFDVILLYTNEFGSFADFAFARVALISDGGQSTATIAHEIGHILHLVHLITETNGPCCNTTKTLMCDPFPVNPIITPLNGVCANGSSDWLTMNMFSPSACGTLRDLPVSFPDNYECGTGYSFGFYTDNLNPVIGCKTNGNVSTISITFINSTSNDNRNFRAFISDDDSPYLEFINDPSTDFNCLKEFPTSRTEARIVDPINAACENEKLFQLCPQCTLTLTLKVRLKANLPSGSAPYRVKINVYTGNFPEDAREFYLIPTKPVNGTFSFLYTNQDWPDRNPIIITSYLNIDNQNVPFNWFPNGYNFKETKKIFFGPGAGMEIVNGAKAIMPHIQIEGCSTMWKGITVREGGTLEMNMMTTIQDAQYAVNVQKGGTAIIESCHFTDNNIGIRTAPEGSGAYNITALGNIFETSEPGLKPAYSGQSPSPGTRGFAGIYTRDMTGGLTIDGDGLFQLSNQFTKLHYGILAENTDVTVRHAKFVDIASATRPSGYPGPLQMGKGVYVSNGKADVKGSFTGIAPQPALFYESHTGIEVSNGTVDVAGCEMSGLNNGVVAVGGANRAYTINWNNISASERGISVFYQSGLPGLSTIGNNTINMTGHAGGVGIGVGGTEMFPQNEGLVLNNAVTVTEGATGILAGVSTRLKITQNTVNLAGAGALFGIRMEGGDRNTINCNTILNPGNGNNDGIYAIHPSRAGILCNTADGSPRGIHFEGMLAGKSKADVAGNTMKNNSAAGLLLGNAAVIGAQTHRGNKWQGTNAVAGLDAPQTSKFTVDAAENADFLPSSTFPPFWFENIPDPSTSYYCIPGTSCPLPNEAGDYNLDIKIVRGELETHAANWLAQRRFYELVMENGNPYPGNSDVNTFLSQAVSNGLANYANIQVGIRQLGGMTESARANAAAGLLSQNGALTGNAPYQANEIAVNSIFLQTTAIGNLTLSGPQITTLEAIASQCPLTGGEAVLRARALLELNGNTPLIYNDGTLCNAQRPSGGRDEAATTEGSFIKVYPNPVSNLLTIEYAQKNRNNSAVFLLFDATGRLIYSCELIGSEGKTLIDVQSLPDGIYMYSVPGLSSGKIQIQH